ncbi:MAG: hypothetical protein ACKN9T_19455 [Candidatus Methylumidiphilus sp.]
MIASLKKLLLTRYAALALSLMALVGIGYGLGQHVPAVLLSAVLFAGNYLLESTKAGD